MQKFCELLLRLLWFWREILIVTQPGQAWAGSMAEVAGSIATTLRVALFSAKNIDVGPL